LLDLAVAITTGFLTSPSAFQAFSFDAPNELISAFPLVMVPVRGAARRDPPCGIADQVEPRCAAFVRGCGFSDLSTNAKMNGAGHAALRSFSFLFSLPRCGTETGGSAVSKRSPNGPSLVRTRMHVRAMQCLFGVCTDGTMRRFRRPSVFAVAKHLPGIRDRN
jgi:hypothetical protein